MNKKEQNIFDKQASNLYENYLLDATIIEANAKPNIKVKKLTNLKVINNATNNANNATKIIQDELQILNRFQSNLHLYEKYANDSTKIISYNAINAKELIRNIMNTKINSNEIAFAYCTQFVEEDNKYFVKCYTLEDKDKEIISFALLRECDFDPYATSKHKQIKPFVLYYIYTFEKYRRQNHAHQLLKNVTEEITAFCNCEASKNLFKKANYEKDISKKSQYITIYRTKS